MALINRKRHHAHHQHASKHDVAPAKEARQVGGGIFWGARTFGQSLVRRAASMRTWRTRCVGAERGHRGLFSHFRAQGLQETTPCIGTIAPVRKSLAEEVIRNGVAAATEDPRFAPVRPEELPHLEYSVDVLGEPEAVDNLEQLDPARYGVIVTRGHQRGLLLPDLEGVDTVFDQIAIAKQKAGIRPDEQVHLERFEVVRHTAGGKPRRS